MLVQEEERQEVVGDHLLQHQQELVEVHHQLVQLHRRKGAKIIPSMGHPLVRKRGLFTVEVVLNTKRTTSLTGINSEVLLMPTRITTKMTHRLLSCGKTSPPHSQVGKSATQIYNVWELCKHDKFLSAV